MKFNEYHMSIANGKSRGYITTIADKFTGATVYEKHIIKKIGCKMCSESWKLGIESCVLHYYNSVFPVNTHCRIDTPLLYRQHTIT